MNFEEIKARLSRFKVGIAGAGGLGSNCAAALVRSGIGTIVITDFDIVEERNLNRQFFFHDQIGRKKVEALMENLELIGAKTQIVAHDLKLSVDNIAPIFSGCDVIVEAFDKAEMKEMLIETVSRHLPGVPLIIGSGLAGWGGNNTINSRKVDNIVANMQANLVLEILLKE